jgi:hypothetical protein
MIKEGPVQLGKFTFYFIIFVLILFEASIYTIIIHTGTISSCVQAKIYLALIGDGASTLPFDLNSNSSCTTKDLFQSGSNERFSISPLEAVDVGRVGNVFHSKIYFQ